MCPSAETSTRAMPRPPPLQAQPCGSAPAPIEAPTLTTDPTQTAPYTPPSTEGAPHHQRHSPSQQASVPRHELLTTTSWSSRLHLHASLRIELNQTLGRRCRDGRVHRHVLPHPTVPARKTRFRVSTARGWRRPAVGIGTVEAKTSDRW